MSIQMNLKRQPVIQRGNLTIIMVLGILPLLIFYIFMQRYIIGGVMAGSVKG